MDFSRHFTQENKLPFPILRYRGFHATVLIFAAPAYLCAVAESSTNASQLIGHWYMGTMTGQDCNLEIRADSTLAVQTGGCFGQNAPIRSSWQLKGDLLIFSNPEVYGILGKFARIKKQGKYIVLVPETNLQAFLKHGPHVDLCFWPNLLGAKGLRLPPEAEKFM